MYNDELKFEADFVRSLQENGWTDGVLKNPTEKDLLNNWAKILLKIIDNKIDYLIILNRYRNATSY